MEAAHQLQRWRIAAPYLPRNMDPHLKPKNLELYILEQLSNEERNRIEEHLLICGPCRDALEQEESFINSMDAATLREDMLIREKDCLPIDYRKKHKS